MACIKDFLEREYVSKSQNLKLLYLFSFFMLFCLVAAVCIFGTEFSTKIVTGKIGM
jgi:hypothetical protein